MDFFLCTNKSCFHLNLKDICVQLLTLACEIVVVTRLYLEVELKNAMTIQRNDRQLTGTKRPRPYLHALCSAQLTPPRFFAYLYSQTPRGFQQHPSALILLENTQEMDPQVIDAQFDRAVQIVQGLPKTGPIQTGYEEKLAMYR